MVKYSLKTKLKAVNDVLERGMSLNHVAKSLHTTRSLIYRWVIRYEEFGADGLSMKAGIYTGDFKVSVVEYIYENNISFSRAAAHFGIPNDTTVGIWERIYREKGPEALYNHNRREKFKVDKDKVKPSETHKDVDEDLVLEVQRLRMENEYLKKLNALVQSREKSARKTK